MRVKNKRGKWVIGAVPNCPFARIKKHWLLYLLLLPSFVMLIIFAYAPMFGLVIAFKDYTILDGFIDSEWVGLKHFLYIFKGTDPAIFQVFRNTVYIALIKLVTNFPLIIIFALMINEIRSNKVKTVVRTISYLPNFISWIAVGGIMFALLSVDGGAINKILVYFKGEDAAINWYASPQYWWGITALTSLWKGLGWSTVIYMSALGCIDSELYDACKIDGGGRMRMIFTVTLPGIMNVVMMQLILDCGNLVRDNYEMILAITKGSPVLSDTMFVVGGMAFTAISTGKDLSMTTAFGLVQGLIGLIFVLVSNSIAKKSDHEGII